jgi:uncharacterized membrane protein
MKKIENYIVQLQQELVTLPSEEIVEIIQDQREYFQNAISNG